MLTATILGMALIVIGAAWFVLALFVATATPAYAFIPMLIGSAILIVAKAVQPKSSEKTCIR